MMLCHAQPAIEITADIAVTGNPGGPFGWTFTRTDNGDPAITVTPNGDFDFTAKGQPIYVTATLHDDSDPSLVFYSGGGVNVFGFADGFGDGYAAVQAVGPVHHQFSKVTLSNGGKTVSFCYTNHRRPDEPGRPDHYKISRYTMYLGDSSSQTSLPYYIDPQIGNGAGPAP
jgi:hypothetical protein